ncbi:MAG TPA: hypothetical protein VK988_10310 [Acidimicrobiales bacterium]|nr:hypothetical protein [Acidimicrobiales bacterium]
MFDEIRDLPTAKVLATEHILDFVIGKMPMLKGDLYQQASQYSQVGVSNKKLVAVHRCTVSDPERCCPLTL